MALAKGGVDVESAMLLRLIRKYLETMMTNVLLSQWRWSQAGTLMSLNLK